VCVNRINGQYAVVYRKTTSGTSPGNIKDILEPGFGFIPKCYGLMDVYADEGSGVRALSALPGLSLTGEGVIIGFVDTGIDYTLKMFQKGSGKTRIKYIWNQADTDYADNPARIVSDSDTASVGHFGFGSLYTAEDIERALSLENPYSYVDARDENGHGTFLASVAAGSEIGIAENAMLAVVRLKQVKENLRDFYCVPVGEPCFSEADIMLGVRFLIEVAAREGKPLVICLGIGTSQGSHQGKSLLEKYLNYVSAYRGVCVISAVGNEYLADAHYHGGTGITTAQAETPVEIPKENLIEVSVEEPVSGFSMELWSSPLIYLDVRLVSPTGEIFSGINPRRNGYYHKRFIYEGTDADIVNVAIDSNAGVQMLFFRFENVVSGIWQLRVTESESTRGEGIDAWLPIRQYTDGKVRFVNPTTDVTICAPGSAAGVITAAAYNAADGTIYVYSSRGFNRSGYIKPDIAASGVDVTGAFAGSGSSREDLLYARSGSSVSSAVLSGMAALVLEWGLVKGNAPYISTEEIRQFFIQGAVRDDYLKYPNTSFGWGVVNLLTSFQRLRL
jgi:hypothetical protein